MGTVEQILEYTKEGFEISYRFDSGENLLIRMQDAYSATYVIRMRRKDVYAEYRIDDLTFSNEIIHSDILAHMKENIEEFEKSRGENEELFERGIIMDMDGIVK